jgi:hypothetical protein
MVCFRHVSVNALHKGEEEDDDDDNNNNNNNNNVNVIHTYEKRVHTLIIVTKATINSVAYPMVTSRGVFKPVVKRPKSEAILRV